VGTDKKIPPAFPRSLAVARYSSRLHRTERASRPDTEAAAGTGRAGKPRLSAGLRPLRGLGAAPAVTCPARRGDCPPSQWRSLGGFWTFHPSRAEDVSRGEPGPIQGRGKRNPRLPADEPNTTSARVNRPGRSASRSRKQPSPYGESTGRLPTVPGQGPRSACLSTPSERKPVVDGPRPHLAAQQGFRLWLTANGSGEGGPNPPLCPQRLSSPARKSECLAAHVARLPTGFSRQAGTLPSQRRDRPPSGSPGDRCR